MIRLEARLRDAKPNNPSKGVFRQAKASKNDRRKNCVWREMFATAKKCQLDEEVDFNHARSKTLDQSNGRARCPTGRKQVIDEKH
jgi:hypothetical protein